MSQIKLLILTFNLVTADSGTTTVLSSALQSATVMSQLKTVTVTTTGSTLLTQQPLQMVNQPKVVSPGQGGIVVTHLAPGNITLRPGMFRYETLHFVITLIKFRFL